ncbi:hypothetical protein JCM1841_005161 [Sporobolomyces salmonicolor]
MASSKASTSRLSLDDWDSLAPLSPAESASVSRISSAAAHRPLPISVCSLLSLSRPRQLTRPLPRQLQAQQLDSPLVRKAASRLDLASVLRSPTSSPRPLSAAASRPTVPPTDVVDPLALSAPIETLQQFHDWFARVEHSIEHSQEEVYRQHLAELDHHLATCETVLEGLDESRGLLSEMEANYRYVEENSRALQLACETMLDEQKHLLEVTEAIGARLEYFRELEGATKMLNLPGEDLVLQEDFLNMIDRLDVCLDYLKANRDFKDAEIYLIRFQQCLTRAMTLIKMYFVSTIRKIATEAAEKMTGKDLSETALHALLYSKFQAPSASLRILLVELEKRAELDPNEYEALRSECYQTWFTARVALLGPGLAEEVRRMDPAGSELIKLAKAGCNHLRGVCMAEWALYKQFFSTGENEVYEFLETLCDHLYDSLRPRILHEPRLDALCELCTVLGAMMALDAERGLAEADDDDDDDEILSPASELAERDPDLSSLSLVSRQSTRIVPGQTRRARTLGRLRFSVLLQTILQDTQTRLVFRAQAVVQSEVLHYAPTPADLEYPEILEREGGGRAGVLWESTPVLAQAEDGETGGKEGDRDQERKFRVPSDEVMRNWFPTLRRTVWVLARLNNYVDNAIFEDFAGEAVTLCRQSLLAAAAQITARADPVSKLDGQLFLVRHLLLLKETVRSVDLVQIERAADFSSVTDALSNMLRNSTAIFNPSTLFEMASKGLPSFAETMTDAKMDLDAALRKGCEELISSTSRALTASLRAFLDRCTSFLSSPLPSSSPRDLSAQAWASPEEVLKLHEAFQGEVEERVAGVRAKMKLYLEEERTVRVLLPPLLEDVVETYTTFYNLTRSEYGFATSSSLIAPSAVKEKLDRAGQ